MTFAIGPLVIGASASFDLVAQATAAGALTNAAAVTGTIPDADVTNHTAQATVEAFSKSRRSSSPPICSGEADNGGAAGKVTVRRTGDVSAALMERYKTKGTPKASTDFKPLRGTVMIPIGAASAKIKIKAINDKAAKGKHVVKIMLPPSPNGSYQLGNPDLAKIKIIDND